MKKYRVGPKLVGNGLKKITIVITLPKWDKIYPIVIANDICGGTNYRSCEITEEK